MSAMMDAQLSPQENNAAKANDVSSLPETPVNADEAKMIDEQPATHAADVTADNSQSQQSTCSASEDKSLNVTFPKQVGNAWGATNSTTIGPDSTPKLADKNANDNNTKKRSNVSFLSSDSIASKPKFADIMAEQELEKDVAKSETISRTKVSFSNEVEVESEEERMMRLAIEASLQEQQGASHGFQSHATKMPASVLRNSHGIDDTGTSSSFPAQSSHNVSFSNNNVAYDANDDMDDDMRMAIALSLQLGGGSGNSYTSAVFEKSPPFSASDGDMDGAMNDIKMEDVEDDRKPSAQPKEGVAMRAIGALKPAAVEIMESDTTNGSEGKSSLSDSVYNPPAAFASASASTSGASCCANSASAAVSSVAAVAHIARTSNPPNDESENLARALHQAELDEFNASQTADADAEAASLQLAMQLQQEEDARQNLEWDAEAARLKREEMCHGGGGVSVGVRTVGRDEFDSLKTDKYHGDSRMIDRRKLEETGMGKLLSSKNNTGDDPGGNYDKEINDYYYYANDRLKGDDAQEYYDHDENDGDDGIRMNSQSSSSKWKRLDKDTFIGPNNEIRTKHDPELKRHSNAAELLGSHGAKLKDAYNHSGNSPDNKKSASVSDRAYNAFRRAESRQSGFKKGVAKQGHGRAENMNAGKTRGGAMDGNVRLQISAAINFGLIENCNGVVKEGKEALVYHANGGCNSEETERTLDTVGSDGYDVAVKVFKRIAEFKGRGSYVDGDPRYHKQKFKTNDQREQVVLWAEKEYRNLIRAHRAGVAVPKPLYQKENVLMMRFLGENGWPSPQLKEIDIKKGSQKWTTLYCQTLVAIRRLFHCARLVHADLSEYNLLICPSWQASHDHFTVTDKRNAEDETLQVVLIDFGMAVETGHPSAVTWLRRDLSTVRDFFVKQGINTLSNEVAEEFVTDSFDGAKHDAMDGTDDTELIDAAGSNENEMQDDNCHIGAAQGKKWRHNKHGWDDDKNMEELLKKLRGSN